MEKIFVKEGITQKQILQLIEYTLTDEIIKKTTRDVERFSNLELFQTWIKNDRSIFTLADLEDNLLGIIWYGVKELPDKNYILKFNKAKYGLTFAIRIYAKARGKGYSKYFLEKAFEKYKNSKMYQENSKQGIWLATTKDNKPAIKTYAKFGFEIVSSPDEENRIIMCQF